MTEFDIKQYFEETIGLTDYENDPAITAYLISRKSDDITNFLLPLRPPVGPAKSSLTVSSGGIRNIIIPINQDMTLEILDGKRKNIVPSTFKDITITPVEIGENVYKELRDKDKYAMSFTHRNMYVREIMHNKRKPTREEISSWYSILSG